MKDEFAKPKIKGRRMPPIRWKRPPRQFRDTMLPPPVARDPQPEFRPITGNRIDLPTIPRIRKAVTRKQIRPLEFRRWFRVLLTEREYAALDKTAADLGLSKQAVYRLALMRFLRQYRGAIDPTDPRTYKTMLKRVSRSELFRRAEQALSTKRLRRISQKENTLLKTPAQAETSKPVSVPSKKKRLMIGGGK